MDEAAVSLRQVVYTGRWWWGSQTHALFGEKPSTPRPVQNVYVATCSRSRRKWSYIARGPGNILASIMGSRFYVCPSNRPISRLLITLPVWGRFWLRERRQRLQSTLPQASCSVSVSRTRLRPYHIPCEPLRSIPDARGPTQGAPRFEPVTEQRAS